MTINELIKKYEEEINKMYGVSTVDEHRFLKDITKVERVISLKEILQDLETLKEKVSKDYEYACECETCIEKNDLLDLIVGSDTDVKN